jgi:hypothetical protein
VQPMYTSGEKERAKKEREKQAKKNPAMRVRSIQSRAAIGFVPSSPARTSGDGAQPSLLRASRTKPLQPGERAGRQVSCGARASPARIEQIPVPGLQRVSAPRAPPALQVPPGAAGIPARIEQVTAGWIQCAAAPKPRSHPGLGAPERTGPARRRPAAGVRVAKCPCAWLLHKPLYRYARKLATGANSRAHAYKGALM